MQQFDGDMVGNIYLRNCKVEVAQSVPKSNCFEIIDKNGKSFILHATNGQGVLGNHK